MSSSSTRTSGTLAPEADRIMKLLAELTNTDVKHLTEGETNLLRTLSMKTFEMAGSITVMASDMTEFETIDKVRMVEKDGRWRWIEDGSLARISFGFHDARTAAADYIEENRRKAVRA
jgi:hypothetical protein